MIIKGAHQVGKTWLVRELATWLEATPLSPPVYWHREARGSSAEVDYVLEHGREIYPIEVEEGTTGSMKSLRLFLQEKQRRRGIKISKDGFSDDGVVTTIPFYGIERLLRGDHA